jgi:cytochrome P450
MKAYTLASLEERKSRPCDDFLGQLSRASLEPDGPSPEEIVGNAMLLLLAGYVAVRNLIGNVVWKHPDRRRLLQADEALLLPAIEETLRFEPPVTLIPRICLDARRALRPDHPARLGRPAHPGLRQPRPRPFSRARPLRHHPQPQAYPLLRHRPHGCAGAHLARLETEIALKELYRRFLALMVEENSPIQWYWRAASRGPISLMVRKG